MPEALGIIGVSLLLYHPNDYQPAKSASQGAKIGNRGREEGKERDRRENKDCLPLLLAFPDDM